MNDADRVRLAKIVDGRMRGPTERMRCPDHPRRWVLYRWTWAIGESPQSDGEVECVRECRDPEHDDPLAYDELP